MTVPAFVHSPSFWGGKFQPQKLTRKESISNYDFHANFNQAYLESLVKPGLTRVSVFTFRFPERGKTGLTMIYQADQAFNQT